jgi:serine/threonine-protein kinase PpkA
LRFSGYSILQEQIDNNSYPEIPGYKILSELGQGGIATVYLAVQESLDRQVALKVMSPLLAMEPDYAERFIREGRTVAQLSHPNIITVYDIGLQKHQLFIAMEYIPGGNMRTLMQKHQHDPEWALSVAGQIALALGYAHKAGIVHRDVKPENILFRENGAAVLTDFGIAKTITSNTNLTRAGTVIGTPKYMSPEQTDGLGNDPRTDIYSLGIILFEMLTGHVPYDSENSMAVLYAHVHSPIPELPDDLSDLQPLLNNLLAKKEADRPDNCDELAEIIRITRRERHYALKDSDTIHETGLDTELQTTTHPGLKRPQKKQLKVNKFSQFTGSLREYFFPADARRTMGKIHVKRLLATLVAVILVIVIISLWIDEPENIADNADTEQLAVDPAGIEHREILTAPDTSSLTNRTPVLSADIDDATYTGAEDKDVVTKQKNQTQLLISRFLADESNDELVRQQQQEIEPADNKNEDGKTAALSNRQKKINQLLTSARIAVQEERITMPGDDNAVSYYKQVLELSPQNRRAIRGLNVSGDILVEKAKQLYESKQEDLALKQIDNALKLIPEHNNLISLKQSIEASFNPNSSYARAEKLYSGVDGPKDHSRAAFYYLKAAELGHILAMNAIGVQYADGDGIPRNDRLAMKWFEKSAELDNSEAMYNLALGYHFSDVRDEKKALPWVRQAADAEYRPAYMLIGWMTTTGTGTRANRVASIRWDLKGMVNPISEELHKQYRIPRTWQSAFMIRYKAATNTGP